MLCCFKKVKPINQSETGQDETIDSKPVTISNKTPERQLKVLLIPLDAYGHVNSCIAIAQQIVRRGHRAIIALESAWAGQITDRYTGLEEVHYTDAHRARDLEANEHWTSFAQFMKVVFGLEPIEALKAFPREFEATFLHNFFKVDDQLAGLISELAPDVIVADTYVSIPAVIHSGRPWVWMTSAHPLTCLPSDDLPPARTGYPTDGDRKLWVKYRQLASELNKDVVQRYNDRLKEEFKLPPPPEGSFCHPSPYLNIYAYPEELDYLDIRPLPDNTWRRYDHFIRTEPSANNAFVSGKTISGVPEEFFNRDDSKPQSKLIFVSMGSIASADLQLMTRLIEMLPKSEQYHFLFSLGPSADRLKPLLASNMWGAGFVQQTQVLPLVDAFITHGGNNSVLEALYFGKPMIVCGLFYDQLDNAQRISEKRLGLRINVCRCKPEELVAAIDQLLSDQDLQDRLQSISEQMQWSDSTEKAAADIEKLAISQLDNDAIDEEVEEVNENKFYKN